MLCSWRRIFLSNLFLVQCSISKSLCVHVAQQSVNRPKIKTKSSEVKSGNLSSEALSNLPKNRLKLSCNQCAINVENPQNHNPQSVVGAISEIPALQEIAV